MKDFIYKSKYYISILFFLLIIFYVVKWSSLDSILKLDGLVSDFVRDNIVSDSLTFFFSFITNMGDVFFLVIVLLGTLLFKNKLVFSCMSLNLLLAYLVNVFYKNIFRRERPLINLIEKPLDFSFPSGHTMCSVAFYGFVIYLISKYIDNKILKWLLIFVCCLLVGMIAISRIYLSVHFFSDVLCGAILGIVCLLMFINYVKIKEII